MITAAQGGHSELIEVLIERYNCSASDRNEVNTCMVYNFSVCVYAYTTYRMLHTLLQPSTHSRDYHFTHNRSVFCTQYCHGQLTSRHKCTLYMHICGVDCHFCAAFPLVHSLCVCLLVNVSVLQIESVHMCAYV